MVTAYVLISAEPSRVQELVGELRGMQLADFRDHRGARGRRAGLDLIAYVESPDMQSLGN